ncbi:aldolase [Thermosipho melanesiensis]|uniref:Class II aldolase/adducin family protein n=2 Tax=Thermosipho melanesiensis TaxID=46541 RepID=A6LP44_THEM4|nr:class II aldolase/adducin family protein [Thermosipho melanesiensis]ABR31695.1 class II aldolase/adducin family protein [Thermosipho melanesiensis BI429]APT74718.1 aldolase [Thermosipho melanesiensis]OOC35219.1 aldolase [Thermosipho melanesiensis]OOC35429.1 aldolase [Thermosipho melanesiensis]OOC36680.1 aldolase [Thermosipho melanesiensis]
MKKEILRAVKFIVDNNLVKGTWGNVSIREGNIIYITPSGVPYDKLKEGMISVVDFNGNLVEGLKPSSELPTHIEIYKSRKDVRAIVHTHPVFSSTISVVSSEIPPIIEDAVMILGPEIKVSEYALPGTWELAKNVVDALSDNHAVILKNHGLITVGTNIDEALTASLICEKTAEIYLYALNIGNFSTISNEDAVMLRNKYLNSYRHMGKDVR